MRFFKISFYKIAIKVLALYWFIFRPVSVGAVVMLLDKNNRVLLVGHSYKNKLHLPGGYMNKKEYLEQTAKRELKEEVGVDIDDLEILFVKQNFRYYKNQITVVTLKKLDYVPEINIDNVEITSYSWHSLNSLPSNLSKETADILTDYIKN